MLRAVGLEKAFGATTALAGVDFEVKQGEVHALVGENGCGKSTLMRLLHGEDQPDQGALFLAEAPYRPRNPLDAARMGVALVHQELAICPHLTAAENIFLGEELCAKGVLKRAQMNQEAEEALSRLGCPSGLARVKAGQLPASLRQMVEIARAVRSRARVILLDEPTSSLGREEVSRLFEVMRALRGQGTALVFISHFLDEVGRIADRVTVLKDGQVAGVLPAAEAPPDILAALMTGRRLESSARKSRQSPGETALEATAISGARLPSGLSLSVRRGEVVGLAGLNASGRSETLRCLFGLDGLRGGRVALFGQDSPASPANSWQRKSGFVSEDRKTEGLALNMSLSANTTLPRPGRWVISRREEEQRTQAVLDLFRVKAAGPSQRMRDLSGGNQQKIALGRLADSGAEVLLLDEPTRGIDIGARADIYQWIDEQAEGGKAIVVASSDLGELLRLCDRIVVLRQGRAASEFEAEGLTEGRLMEACAG